MGISELLLNQSKQSAETDERPVSRVRWVMREILKLIRDQDMRVGDRLPSEGQIAQRLEVSRQVMREAFGALSALGVVDVGNGRLPKVSGVSSFPMVIAIDHALYTGQVTFSQVWETRRRLEGGAAALAARHRTDEEAANITSLAQAMADCRPMTTEMVDLDIAFHRSIAVASHNLLFEQIIGSFEPLMARAVPLAWSTRTTPHHQSDILAKHRRVAEAITEQDPNAAEAAMEAHFDESIASILESSANLALR